MRKKGKNTLSNYHSARNSDIDNHPIRKQSSDIDTTSATEQNVDTMSAPVTTATNQSSTLMPGALHTISKQVKEISDFLPEVAKRRDLQQLIDATNGQGKIISERLEDKLSRDVNFRLSNIDTLTKNVDRKIDGVLRKKDFDFAETRLSNKIQQAEDSARQNIRSDMERGLQALLTELQSKISRDSNSATNSVNNSVNSAAQKILNSQKNSKNALTTQLNDLEGQLKNIRESTEMIQSLPGKIDGLTDILSAKGLQIKQEFPVLNHDEETLAQLAQYGEKILQQLAIAARWYARKMPEISKHETTIKNLNETHEKDLIRAGKDGEARGRKAAVRDLLARYGENIHDLMTSAENDYGRLNVLSEFLKNEGVEQIYQLHEVIEITDDKLMNYEHNIANLRAGKIVITSPGYSFDNQVISKATYMLADEFFAAQATEHQVEENSVVDTPSEKIAADSQAEDNLAPQSADAPHESEDTIPSEKNSVAMGEELSTATNEVTSNEKNSAEG